MATRTSAFPYCDLVTLCLAWGLPGLWWVLQERLLSSLSFSLPLPQIYPFIPQTL